MGKSSHLGQNSPIFIDSSIGISTQQQVSLGPLQLRAYDVTVVGVFKEARCHGLTLDKSKKILTEQLINSDSKLVFNGQT